VFAERILEFCEMMGDEINKDEMTAAILGDIGVEYYKIGSLYSYLHFNGLIEEYENVLIKNLLELEPKMLNRSKNKYQVIKGRYAAL